MAIATELVAHIILLGFASYVILSADPGSSLFSYHPTCMVLAWVFLTEGVLLFRKPSVGWRVAVHWALMASGLSLAIGGFLAIYRNKEDSKKDHFTTYHSLAGICTLVLLIVQAIGGNLANFSVPISKKVPLVKPKLIKWGHRMSGGISLTAVTLTIFLALFSFWFQAVTKTALWWTCATVIAYPLVHTLKVAYL